MNRRLEIQQSDDEDEETYKNDVVLESPSSSEDSKISKPSSKKSRKSAIEKKRVVSLPIADVERSKSRIEVYPPSDSWTWRKYGQKPIKGSPYPRGYYKCSSSKGCPARKQVERSRVDPTKLVVTYAGEHNHPLPSASATAGSHKFHQNRSNIVLKATKKENDEDEVKEPVGLDLSHVDSPLLLGSCYSEPEEFGWFYDVAFSAGADVAMERVFSVGQKEEEESLFGDLDDLPDCAAMFRRGTVAGGDRNRRCDFGAVSLCDSSR